MQAVRLRSIARPHTLVRPHFLTGVYRVQTAEFGPPISFSKGAFRGTQQKRMASSEQQPQRCEWFVVLPDQDGALQRRMEVREQHLANLKKDPEEFWLWGGAFLEEPPKQGETPKMKGSALLVMAATREEVLKRLKEDIYTSNEVWDWSQVQIYPFKSALRKGL